MSHVVDPCTGLVEVLKKVTDPRGLRGRRFPSHSILSICVLATLSGANSLRAISEWASSLCRRDLRRLGGKLKRAFVSISLNISEGAGEFSRSEKARFYRMSRRSATECAAVVDICKELELGTSALWTECRLTPLSIVSMLVKLIKSMNGQPSGQGHPLR